jgi:hypothetical protein
MYKYLYIYVYAYICIYICTYRNVYIYVHVYILIFIHMYIYEYIRNHCFIIRTGDLLYICIYLYTCIYMYVYKFTCVYECNLNVEVGFESGDIMMGYVYICIWECICNHCFIIQTRDLLWNLLTKNDLHIHMHKILQDAVDAGICM